MPTVTPPKPTEAQKRSSLLAQRFEKRFGFDPPGSLARMLTDEQIDELTRQALKDGEPPKGWREASEAEMSGELDL